MREIRVGVAGWSYDDWRGVVYPTNREPGFHEANYLAGFLPLLEINTSFYRPLRPELARVWVQKLGGRPGFELSAKLYKGFTHERNLDRRLVRETFQGFDPLAEADLLGCVLMQFPWSFRLNRENLRYLTRVARTFSQFPLAAEFRHASWNDVEALETLAEHGVAFCNLDQPQMNGCLQPTEHVTSEIGYVRLHGRNYNEWFNFDEGRRQDGRTGVQARYDYLYSPEQLEKWRARIERIAGHTKTTYVVANNHFQGKAVVNALEILAGVTGSTVEVPPTLLDHYPELLAIASNRLAQRVLPFKPRPAADAWGAPPLERTATAIYARA